MCITFSSKSIEVQSIEDGNSYSKIEHCALDRDDKVVDSSALKVDDKAIATTML